MSDFFITNATTVIPEWETSDGFKRATLDEVAQCVVGGTLNGPEGTVPFIMERRVASDGDIDIWLVINGSEVPMYQLEVGIPDKIASALATVGAREDESVHAALDAIEDFYDDVNERFTAHVVAAAMRFVA